jgi:hypothetical protein
MQKVLHVIGVGHHYQFGAGTRFGSEICSVEAEKAFIQMLRNAVLTTSADAIAEELSEQALSEVGKSTSVIKVLADSLDLPHLYCDPDRAQRCLLNIRDENEIRLSDFPNQLDEIIVQKLMAESWFRREREWLRRLSQIEASRIIFVCVTCPL